MHCLKRKKPVRQQTGAIECQTCKRYCRVKGGYSVHKCSDMHGKTFFVTFLCPHLKVQGHAWACTLEPISSDIVFAS